MHDGQVKKNCAAALLVSAISLSAVAGLGHEVATTARSATATSDRPAGTQSVSGPRDESLPAATLWLTSTRAAEIEKWAFVLLELCAAGCVLARSRRETKTPPRAFNFLSAAPGSEFDDAGIHSRTL
jgi:hypothetical protein